MIRWYDWVVAIVLADTIVSSSITVITSDLWLAQIFSALVIWAAWDLWTTSYIPLRKSNEELQ
jgi:hypothetical protein